MTWARLVSGATFVALLMFGSSGAALAFDTGPAGSPDLTPYLPSQGNKSWQAPTWVDTYEQPGHVLYRFDGVIWANGPASSAHGALDLFKDPATGHAMQAVFANGAPSVAPDPNVDPTGQANTTVIDLTATRGASFVYSYATGHNHWHFQNAESYQLVLPGGISRPINKVGFCMYDTYTLASRTVSGTPDWYKSGYVGQGPYTWCAKGHPEAALTREGITPNRGDRYAAKAADQWVDITGLTPGVVGQLVETVNPNGYIAEADYSNNQMSQSRMVQGTVANPVSAQVAGDTSSSIDLSGTVYNTDPTVTSYNPLNGVTSHEVPARASASCLPPASGRTDKCLVFDGPSPQLTFAVTQPSHGSVSVASSSGTGATVSYQPASGYTGPDSFTYTVTDARGLTSQPATVSLDVGSGGGGGGGGGTSTVTMVSGSPQSAAVNTSFSQRLKVRLVDANGQPMVGVAIKFSGPTSGPGTIFSNGLTHMNAKTNSTGYASVAAKANSLAGSYVVTANVASTPLPTPATFQLTNTS